MFKDSIAIDLGTVNTLICDHSRGVVLNEASAVALSASGKGEVLAVGNEAIEMRGRTPHGITVRYPLKDGVVADYMLAEYMMREFIKRATGKLPKLFGIRILMCVPGCITVVERHAMRDAARHAGAREVFIIDEAMAAAIGAGLPVDEPVGSMIVDIGGGTTDVAVVTLNGIAASKSIRVGGTHMDEAIAAYIRREHGVAVGVRTSERLKLEMANAIIPAEEIEEKPAKSNKRTAQKDNHELKVRGLCLDTGLPAGIAITAREVSLAMAKPVESILSAISDVLAMTPPELAADIMHSGIMLTGGGAMLKGMCMAVSERTHMNVRLCETPMESVVMGAMSILEGIEAKSLMLNEETGSICKRGDIFI